MNEGLRAAHRRYQREGGIADLTSRLKLSFTGNDRQRYLNGQLTANLLTATPPDVLPACVTTAKGKLSGDVFVTVGADTILLDADGSLADTLPARLERYIVADDVAMADVTTTTAMIHAFGVPAEKLLQFGFTKAPVRRFGVEGYDLPPCPRGEAAEIWEKLASQFPVASEELLEIIRIENGVPKWGYELGENTLPPEAGLDRTHIDYHKGCYIGQEVISRLKSVGHVNRQLTGFIAEAPLPAGGQIVAADQAVGEITSATWSFALERPIALGYLRRGAPRDALLVRPAQPGAEPVRLTVCDLPFTK